MTQSKKEQREFIFRTLLPGTAVVLAIVAAGFGGVYTAFGA